MPKMDSARQKIFNKFSRIGYPLLLIPYFSIASILVAYSLITATVDEML